MESVWAENQIEMREDESSESLARRTLSDSF